MILSKSLVKALLVACILLLARGYTSSDTGSEEPICGSTWFAEQAAAAENSKELFLLIPGSPFTDSDHSYVAAVNVPRDWEKPGVRLLFFERKDNIGPYRQIYEEDIRIELLAIADHIKNLKSSRCQLPNLRPWRAGSVVDLDGDARVEIVIQSNEVGGCGACHSTVRVYQVSKQKISKVLEEAYQDIHFANGKGLVLRAVSYGPRGDLIPREVRFFVVAQ